MVFVESFELKVTPRYLKFSTKVRGLPSMLSDSGPMLRLRENIMATDLSSDITKPHFLHQFEMESRDDWMVRTSSGIRRPSLQIAQSSAKRACCESIIESKSSIMTVKSRGLRILP